MARWLKQSTAFTFRIGPFLDSTDGVTAETGLSIAQADMQISKNGGAFAQTSATTPTTTHDTDGWYQCPLTATDTNTLGPLSIQIVMAGALPVWEHFMVVPANEYDSLISGSDALDVEVASMAANTLTATAIASNAITSAKIAASAIGASQIASNAITSAKIATDAIGAAQLAANAIGSSEIAAGAITAAKFAASAIDATAIATDAITAAKIAADAIGASELATDAVNEIRDSILADSTAFNGADIATIIQILQDLQITRNTAQAGAAGTITLAAGESATDDIFNDQLIVLVSGTGAGQSRLISDYNGTTKVANVTPNWQTNPDATSVYSVFGWGRTDVALVEGIDATDQIRDSILADSTTFNGADVAAIVVDTNELQVDWVDGGRLDLIVDAILADTNELQTDDVPGLIAALNDLSAAAVNAEVDTALADINLDHLVGTATGIPAVPAGTYLDQIMDDGTATFDRTTDSLQAIRDRGDTAWITGGGGGLTQIIKPSFVIPISIDLANTATVRIGINLVNAVDDLPSTAEITPGTISIERKAIGGTSWSAVVTDAAMSESAGQVYYDEVFDAGTGYAEGDSIRITFKSVSVTADANTHEVIDATGILFQTYIRETMRGTDSAYTGTPPTAVAIRTEIDSNSTQLAAIVGDTNELQGDWVDGGRLDLIVDAILADTNELQTDDVPGLIAALNDLSAAAVNAEVDTALSDIGLDHLVAAAVIGTDITDNSIIAKLVSASATADWDDFVNTTDALQALRDNLATASALTTVDTVVDAIKAVTDLLPDAGALSDLATILADTNELQGDWANGGRLDLLLDAVKVVTDALTSAAATQLALSAGTIVSGAAEAGTLSTTQMTTDLAEATDDHYNGRIIIWTSGVLQNQATDITDYAGSNGLLTFTAVTEAPSAADTFVIV